MSSPLEQITDLKNNADRQRARYVSGYESHELVIHIHKTLTHIDNRIKDIVETDERLSNMPANRITAATKDETRMHREDASDLLEQLNLQSQVVSLAGEQLESDQSRINILTHL